MHNLSIITINYNNSSGLQQTIESVINQDSNDFEYIVIDGGSTDGSKKIITQFEAKINFWTSESDKGIYEAMNKGIKKATGEYLLFLNSGDYFYSNNIISSFIEKAFKEDVVIGDLQLKADASKQTFINKIVPDVMSAKYLFFDYIPHPSTFIKRSLFATIGLYNEQNRIVSDWEFFLKSFLIHNVSYARFKQLISVFITDGFSCKPENSEIIEKEKEKVFKSLFFWFYKDYYEQRALELKTQTEKNSLEYKVICFFKKIGLMKLFVLIFRGLYKIK